ncbi:hypothetical protein FQN52_003787 [Onygenales sp. PD_12]|nr:hypothetical protein FQN52_003787 [Onygenales sp. PD_12]
MLFSPIFFVLLSAIQSTIAVDWKTFDATGINLGGWLLQEAVIDPEFWSEYSGGAPDEWGLCANLGSQCSPVLEQRYATYITPADIDKLAGVGINVLRIPTTYAAWVKVPGSQLYTGNQVQFLNDIATYAITKHGMHIIIDIHSLPGGVNGLEIGEAEGHLGWFHNETALDYSYQAIDAVIDFIQGSSSPQSYTIAPINEPADLPEYFGTPESLSEEAAAWTAQYIQGVIDRVSAADPNIPIMFQGGFKPEAYWSPSFDAGANLVFDVHNYYFAGRDTDSDTVTADICSDAKLSQGDGKFPVFIGEWSIQTVANNKFENRRKNLNAGLYAFGKYTRGSAYWTARFFGNVAVDGEGVQGDYWNFEEFIDLGYINPVEGAEYCADDSAS